MALSRFFIEVDGVTITGEGVVTVTGAPDSDPGPAIAAFIAALDPATIEQAALAKQGWGSGSLTAAILDVLAAIARGEQP